MNNDEVQQILKRRHFAKKGADQQNWFDSASSLVGSMKVMEPAIMDYFDALRDGLLENTPAETDPKRDHHFTFLMLGGYAIENLCKGFLVGSLTLAELTLLREKGMLPKSLKKHDLAAYIAAVGFRPSSTQWNLIERATAAVLWLGRYPIPTTSEQMAGGFFTRGDIRRMFNLIESLRRHVGGAQSSLKGPA
jgi:hypothetical protein